MIEIFDYSQKSFDYRTVLFQNEHLRQNFELLCIYARRFSGLIPISFLTGFYVTQVVSRWWSEFLTLPWPDKIAFKLASYIPGKVLIHHIFIISECPSIQILHRICFGRTSGEQLSDMLICRPCSYTDWSPSGFSKDFRYVLIHVFNYAKIFFLKLLWGKNNHEINSCRHGNPSLMPN